ncbi:MAG: gluconate:H+ symporter [Verrucomicrobiae bacterium]|nr:gluconate:H+ symporter [Verrucomicrobiae bacterium]
MSPETRLLLVTLAGVLGLVGLVAGLRLHAFLALAVASLGVGLAAGLPPLEVARAFQDGVGATLGLIVVVVGLGTMLGRMLAESGGATVLAETLVRRMGPRRLPWAVLFASFLVAFPVFFAVGLVLLAPVVVGLARTTGTPMIRLALPLLAGLAVCHTLVPPHPGPVVAVGLLQADMGLTILWATVIGLPTAALCGPFLTRFLERGIPPAPAGLGARLQPTSTPARPPSPSIATLTILLPVGLMLLASGADLLLPAAHPARPWTAFAGAPLVAMLAAVLLSLHTFGTRCGFSRDQSLKFTEDCVGPAASIFLVVGAGGGFSRVLDVAGVDDALAGWGAQLALSPLLLAYVVAASLRVAVGSATVAITMASAIVAPVAAVHPDVRPELLVVALGAGTLTLSHFNDGGFWFVKEYFGLTVGQTFRTWTVMVTAASLVALALVLLADRILRTLA